MENNLHRIEKDLRSIAKRYKSVKYSIGLAILFLMLGVSAFSEEVNTKAQVAQIATREELKTSVGDVQTKLNVLRENNKKEIKNLNLELVQLMEQGAQVVKSPWASWQFGMNYFYENWGSSYKGRGDKKEKYPYEGVLTRESGANEFNRYVSENSPMYSYLSKGNDPRSASSSLRGKTNGYGLASNTTIPENPVSFTVTASIKPRIVTKGAINVTPPEEISPTLPKAIDFKPVTPEIVVPSPDPITVNILSHQVQEMETELG